MYRLTLDDLIYINKELCLKYFDEPYELINKNNLLSALSIYDSYYDSENEIAAALFKSLIIAHGFKNANKRTAFIAVAFINKPLCSDKCIEKLVVEIANNSQISIKYLVNKLYNVDYLDESKKNKKKSKKPAMGWFNGSHPNAGNVEYNVAMFNHMNGTGPMPTDLSTSASESTGGGEACCEDCTINDSKKLIEKIVEIGNKYQVQSEKGKNMGTYDTKKEAERRLRQIHYFKNRGNK